MPFGDGARACVGKRFAWEEALIALIRIYQRCASRGRCTRFQVLYGVFLPLSAMTRYRVSAPTKMHAPLACSPSLRNRRYNGRLLAWLWGCEGAWCWVLRFEFKLSPGQVPLAVQSPFVLGPSRGIMVVPMLRKEE